MFRGPGRDFAGNRAVSGAWGCTFVLRSSAGGSQIGASYLRGVRDFCGFFGGSVGGLQIGASYLRGVPDFCGP